MVCLCSVVMGPVRDRVANPLIAAAIVLPAAAGEVSNFFFCEKMDSMADVSFAVRAACSVVGVRNLNELCDRARFASPCGFREEADRRVSFLICRVAAQWHRVCIDRGIPTLQTASIP